jgi:hypothetical protein
MNELTKLASGEADPIGDLAADIVTELEREICGRETAWHAIELHAVVEELLRKAENQTIAKLRGALLAIVACPDYRNIYTHEMTKARRALEDTQP